MHNEDILRELMDVHGVDLDKALPLLISHCSANIEFQMLCDSVEKQDDDLIDEIFKKWKL